jgi:ribose transport system ATP-binding protein
MERQMSEIFRVAADECAHPGVADHVRIDGLVKTFGPQRALNGVDLSFPAGRVHALLGANGSGKSTLLKILSGYHRPDAGRVWLWDHWAELPMWPPQKHGVVVVHQDLGLITDLTVLENFCLSSTSQNPAFRLTSWQAKRRQLLDLADQLKTPLDPKAIVRSLRPAQKAALALARALSDIESSAQSAERPQRHDLLLLDEITVYLGPEDRGQLRRVVRGLAEAGTAVVMVTHDFQDVFEFCDDISVLRDGNVVGGMSSSEVSAEELAGLITGQSSRSQRGAQRSAPGDTAIALESITTSLLGGVSLDVKRGEIHGLTGLAGSGHEDLPYVAAGLTRPRAGTVRLPGPTPTAGGRRRAQGTRRTELRARVGLVPGDRAEQGVWAAGSVRENLAMGRQQRYATKGFVYPGTLRRASRRLVTEFNVKARSDRMRIASLSGGNQQKVLLARVLSGEPEVLVLHEPTQGIDVGVAEQIIELLRSKAAAGVAILVCSIDHEMLMKCCDRISVIHDGSLHRTIGKGDFSAETLLLAAQGR